MLCKLITPKELKDNKIFVKENTQFVLDLNNIDKLSLDFIFSEPGISAQIVGVYKLDKNEKLDLNIKVTHLVPNTSCFVDIKGALYGESLSSHMGEIHIEKEAFGTVSYLNDHTLLLGDTCRTLAMPNLQIKNNDVKASHGASIGSIDENKIYYLQSRGFSEKESIGIIVNGFFESTFDEITDQNMANILRQKMLTSKS